MRQEYLFSDSDVKKELHDYDPNNGFPDSLSKPELKVIYSAIDVPNTASWIAVFETTSNSEDAARKLSTVDEYITKKYSSLTLTNESSAYFDRVLYPRINTFERLLRKLLYLMATIDPDGGKNINDLEDKDFGDIFNLLFTDTDFVTEVRKRVNKNTYSKYQIANEIQSIDEKTLWNKLSGDDYVPSLDKTFLQLKEYRNDVMHAHNINYDRYLIEKKLYDTANNNITDAINKLEGGKVTVPDNFNANLAAGMQAFANVLDAITSEENIEKVRNTMTLYGIALGKVMDAYTGQFNGENDKETVK